MSKVVADQQGSRGPPWPRRGAVWQGRPHHRTIGDGRDASGGDGPGEAWAAVWGSRGLRGLPQREPLQRAASGGQNCLDGDSGKQLSPNTPFKAWVLGLMGDTFSVARLQVIAAEKGLHVPW